MRGWRGWRLCQPETNCCCNLRSKPTLCHMDSWSEESNNYTQHVVKGWYGSWYQKPISTLLKHQTSLTIVRRFSTFCLELIAPKWHKRLQKNVSGGSDDVYWNSHLFLPYVRFIYGYFPTCAFKNDPHVCIFYHFTMDPIIQSSKSTSWGQIGSPSPRPPNLFKFEHWNLVNLSTRHPSISCFCKS